MKFGYTILFVPNVTAAIEFYERAFDVPRRFIHESGQYAELETGATTLAFAAEDFVSSTSPFRPNRPDTPPAGAEIAFLADDVAQSYQRALAAGAHPVFAPEQKPWGQTVSYVRDLNGFLVEICSPVTA